MNYSWTTERIHFKFVSIKKGVLTLHKQLAMLLLLQPRYLECDYSEIKGAICFLNLLKRSLKVQAIRIITQYRAGNPDYCRLEVWLLCLDSNKELLSYCQKHEWRQSAVSEEYILAKVLKVVERHRVKTRALT